MAIITEITDDDRNKKPEEVEKKPKEEENQNEKPKEEEENQNEKPKEEEEEEEEENRNEKQKEEEDRSSFPIPDELTETCVARVRRCHYPMVSQVSSYFRRLIASSSLYETRSRLGLTERVLYASVGFLYSDLPRLYILNRNKFILLDSLPHMPSGSALVTIGTDLYVIGGSVGQGSTSNAILIDCRTHKYRSLPSMRRARCRAAAGVIDGSIYVIGGCEERSSDSDWIEVFNVEKQIWNAVPGPYPYASLHLRGEFDRYVVMEDKFYIWDPACCLVYEPKGRCHWRAWIDECPLRGFWKESCCVIDDMLYTIDPQCTLGHPIVVYNPKENTLRPVKGVTLGYILYRINRINLPRYLNYLESKMANFGGKLVILGRNNDSWYISNGYGGENVICCVKIALERRQGGEIWGEVESVDYVLRDPKTPDIEFCRTLTF